MKAAIFEQFRQPLTIQNVPDPVPSEDGVVVQVKANGICRSDWHGWMGHDSDVHLPHVPGHELAGVVAQTGQAVRRWKVGDRVTVPFSVGCGSCPQCLSGNQQICDHYFQPGFTAWGSFAQYVAIRYADTNLVRLPDEMDFVESASLGCRFITAFRAVVAQGRTEPGEWVVVHGCGGLGLASIMIAHAMGAGVIGVDIQDSALNLASAIGAQHVINSKKQDRLIETIGELTHGGAHVSLDTLGSIETCRNSIMSLRKRGRHVQVGLMVADYKDAPVPMNWVIAKELEIVGSHGMQAHAYEPMLQMILERRLDPKRLITKTVSLEESLIELQNLGDNRNAGVIVIDRF
jgi:alcohol dehydrogenase